MSSGEEDGGGPAAFIRNKLPCEIDPKVASRSRGPADLFPNGHRNETMGGDPVCARE